MTSPMCTLIFNILLNMLFIIINHTHNMLMGSSILPYSSEVINSAQYEECKNSKACHCLAPLGLALIDHIMENRRVKYPRDPWCHRHVQNCTFWQITRTWKRTSLKSVLQEFITFVYIEAVHPVKMTYSS